MSRRILKGSGYTRTNKRAELDGTTDAELPWLVENQRLALNIEWWFMSDQIDEREIAAALFELITSNSSPDWFTEQELAIYLRLVNKDGKPVTAGIRRWVARDPQITHYREGMSVTYHDSIAQT
jgi:hypothetical protein